jgi:hypothetical protein
MCSITTARWTEAGKTWFAISGAGPELATGAEHLLMGYERHGDEWRCGYHADTPGLEVCWWNFSSCAELMLRQAAGLEPVPWREALRELCRRTRGLERDWWLTDSAAAMRGDSHRRARLAARVSEDLSARR